MYSKPKSAAASSFVPQHRRIYTVFDLKIRDLKDIIKRAIAWHHSEELNTEVSPTLIEISSEPIFIGLFEHYFNDNWTTYWRLLCDYGFIEFSASKSVEKEDHLPSQDYVMYCYVDKVFHRRHLVHVPQSFIILD